MIDNDLKSQINMLKCKMENTYGINPNIVDDFLTLNHISYLKGIMDSKIRYKYLDDEFGREAREVHKKSPLRRAYPGDAGIDLPVILSESHLKHGGIEVWPNEREILHTGICMEFPVGYYGRIIHRSSTEKNHRLRVIEGIIDDYRGEILVQVHNTNTCKVKVYHGDRLAQIILARTYPFPIEETAELRPSARGNNGFGSSGK